MIEIIPVTITNFPELIAADRAVVPSFTINKENIESPASATVNVGSEDKDGNFIQKGGWTVAMTAEQYADWGTDDTYAIDCFLTNLGLERA